MKKLFFTLCALCLCGTMWGAEYDSATGLYYDYVTYDSNSYLSIVAPESGSYSIANLTKNDDGSYSIPEYVGDNLAITRVDEAAFKGALADTTNPIHLVIPAYITNIAPQAFQNCTQIEEVTYEYDENSLKDECDGNNDGTESFLGCTSLKTVNLNRNVTTGSSTRFCTPFCWHESITTINIGEHVTSIANYMFYGNKGEITSITCYSMTPPSFGTNAIAGVNSTESTLYVYESAYNAYSAASGWSTLCANIVTMDDPDIEIDALKDIDTGLYFDFVEIEVDGVSQTFTSIVSSPLGAYDDENLVKHETISNAYTLPEKVSADGETYYYLTRIDDGAFTSSLISGHLVIPAYITRIGEAAFDSCTGLTEVTFEYSETALLDENAYNNSSDHRQSFRDCTGIETVNLYRHINLGHGGGYLCGPFVWQNSIKTINIGPRVDEIPAYMFRDHNSTSTQRVIEVINCYALTPPTTTYDPFGDITEGCVVNVPAGLVDTYAAASYSSSSLTGDNATTWGGYFGEGYIKDMDDAFAITTHKGDEGDESDESTAYATFYNSASGVELFNPDGDTELTAYVAYQLETEEDGELVIDLVEIGSVIPASTGVVVETEKAGTYLAIATTEDATTYEDNLLYGETDEDGYTVAPGEGSYYFYLLSSYNGEVGFYWGATGGGAFICQAHRAYLALEQGSGSQGISIRKGNGGEDTTGISSVENAVEGATVKGIYTIQGVRVSNMNQPGLYIVDGKKVLKR